MCYEEDCIELSDDVEAIISKNLNEKTETVTVNIESCEDCRYYGNFWFWGRPLHCCGQESDIPISTREIEDLYENCQINHQYDTVRTYIKRYGIVHYEGSRYHKGSISVVDFKNTVFESDGHNPDIDYDVVMGFYYKDEDEAEKMMELAVQYYHYLNLDEKYCKKNCYG